MSAHKLFEICLLSTLLALAGGCSEGGIGGTGGTVAPPPPEPVSDALLVPAGSADQYNQYIASSLTAWSMADEEGEDLEQALASPFPAFDEVRESSVQGDSPDAGDSAFNGPVTGTNLIVSGVDEADSVKYDGQYFYLANRDHITILTSSADSASQVLSNLKLDSGAAEFAPAVDGLYHDEANQQLVALSGRGYFGRPGPGIAALSILPYPQINEALVRFVDIGQPEVPENGVLIAIEGSLIESRRIGEQLILLTRFSPEIDGFVPFAADEKTQDENRKILETTDFSKLVPQVTVDGVSSDLISADACLIPNPETVPDVAGYPVISSIVTIDLATRSVANAICLADDVSGVHMTEQSLYIASPGQRLETYHAETTFHRFDLAEVPSYQASGSVGGSFWGDPAFLMGEKDGQLVVITTRENDSETRFSHHLSVLDAEEGSDRLEVIGSIPNDIRPEPIGKPGEQIFASRILGDRAYIVTFERIDPVYAIDLTDTLDPRILGELEIPGFSSYLHPISDDYLLGIGTNVSDEGDFPVNNGVNIRLFDVSDPANVRLADEASLGKRWSFSPVAFDYKAFSIQQQPDGNARIALPVYRYGSHIEDLSDDGPSPWTDTALHLFDVRISGDASLAYVGRITSENHDTGERFQPGCCSWQDRSFLNGDTVYYLSKSRLFKAGWLPAGDDVTNTFIPTQFPDPDAEACIAVVTEPLQISLTDLTSGRQVGCGSVSPDELVRDLTCDVAEISTVPEVTGPGSYTVTASAGRYAPRTVEDVRITEGTCGLGTTYLNLYLEPL